MKLTDFDYVLPDALIAQAPLANRRDSRLLVLEGAQCQHRSFPDVMDYVNSGDLLVFNNTKVIPARLYGQKSTGGKIEVLVERILDEHSVLAHVRASKSPKPGSVLLFGEDASESAVMEAREGDLFRIVFEHAAGVLALLKQFGHMPLPPYIDREDTEDDETRYQTVYAQKEGAVAAPTAGLHFDKAILQQLADKGVNTAYVTLHVGAGTFQPVRVDNIIDHKMHAEYIEVSAEVCEQIKATKAAGKRVVCVGTTSVRSLESAAASGELKPFKGDSEIFIYPGYEFKVVDALLTNFHLPQSTLLMLVSAFSGYEEIMTAYKEAVKEEYRFFSYGDAMFLQNKAGR